MVPDVRRFAVPILDYCSSMITIRHYHTTVYSLHGINVLVEKKASLSVFRTCKRRNSVLVLHLAGTHRAATVISQVSNVILVSFPFWTRGDPVL